MDIRLRDAYAWADNATHTKLQTTSSIETIFEEKRVDKQCLFLIFFSQHYQNYIIMSLEGLYD